MNVSYASGSLDANPFIPGNSIHVFPLGAAGTYCCIEREEMGLEEAVYPQPGSRGVHPFPGLEPGRKSKHISSDYFLCSGKPIDIFYNICCFLGGSKESIYNK